jgi:hypothetical protein
LAATLTVGLGPAFGVNGVILDQQLNDSNQGYTVIRLWGSYYEMGYAHATLLADAIVRAVAELKMDTGVTYDTGRNLIKDSIWMPPEIEDELDGMVDSLASTYPAADIDKLDLKLLNVLGDWLYACRSHTCWGRYVQDPVKTLSTRRLDFGSPIPTLNHHVLIVYIPNGGSIKWVNLSWPGIVTSAHGVNEFGTLVFLHDYNSWGADVSAGRMSRMVACRHALTYANGIDLSTHLTEVFAELQDYEVMTGTFLNYYAPEGHGGVMTCNPNQHGPDFYHLRTPMTAWHHGEAMLTTNRWTSGTYTPSDEDFGADAYYEDESAKSQLSHWNLLEPEDSSNEGLQRLSIAYRGREDMTIWADGRLDGVGRTPRLEYEWSELFDLYEGRYDFIADGIVDLKDFSAVARNWLQDEPSLDIAPPPDGDGVVDFRELSVLAEYWLTEVPGDGLVAHWMLDEGAGSLAHDSIGDNDAELHGAEWTDGKINGALQFNGLNAYLDCGDNDLLSPEQMTLAMWLEPGHMGGMRYIASRANRGSGDIDYALMRHRAGEVELAVGQLGSAPVSVMSTPATPLGEWTHVAVSLDGSEASVYINGEPDGSATYGQRIPAEGYWLVLSSLRASTRFYFGKIDDVRLYNVALSEQDVAALYSQASE